MGAVRRASGGAGRSAAGAAEKAGGNVNPNDFRDLEAEAGALGAVLISSAAWDEVAALAEADFTDAEHAHVFRALQACSAAKEPQDTATVARRPDARS